MRSQRQKILNRIDESPATSMQKDYARSLGITLPEAATKSDAKALIDLELDSDEPASEGLKAFAIEKGMKFSDYVGNKYLHNLLFDNLEALDKVIFFCFCIYKFHFNDSEEHILEHPKKEVFQDFGEQYVKDSFFVASMEEYVGEELIAFGKSEKVTREGKKKTIYGGSIYTRAYKNAYDYLKAYI